MRITGLELVSSLLDGGIHTIKLVFNESGAVFFPATEQHRDQKIPGVSYEDDYLGNALAAILSYERMDIRYHNRFADTRVVQLVTELIDHPELSFLKSWKVNYQGRSLQI
jgi:hypothetical protein